MTYTELAIMSVAFGFSVGYLIKIIDYLADNGWNFDGGAN